MSYSYYKNKKIQKKKKNFKKKKKIITKKSSGTGIYHKLDCYRFTVSHIALITAFYYFPPVRIYYKIVSICGLNKIK